MGDGFAVADQDRLPEPAVGAGLDADAGGDELGGGLPLPLDAFDLDVLPGAAEDFLEGADPFDADAGEGVGDEPADAAAGPDEAVLFEQHQGFADHGAADLHVRAELRFGGEHGAGRQQVVADGLGDPGVHGNPERRAGLGLHRLGQEPGGVLVHVIPRLWSSGIPAYDTCDLFVGQARASGMS